MHQLFFIAICLIWGSQFIMMSRAGLAIGPVEIAFWRLLGGSFVMFLCWWWSGHPRIARRSLPHLALVAFFGNAIPFALQPLLIARGFGHSYFGMTISFVPLLTIVASVLMLGIWPRWNQLVGVVGGLLAIMVLLSEGRLRGMSADTLVLAMTVPTSYACCNTYIKWKLHDVPAVAIGAMLTLMGAVYLLPLVLIPGWAESLGFHAPEEPQRWAAAIAALAWIAVVGTGLSMAMFMSNLQARGPLFAGMVSYPVPIVAMAWGIYDGEPITGRQVFAIAVILAMTGLVQLGGKRLWRENRDQQPAGSEQQAVGRVQKAIGGEPQPEPRLTSAAAD